MYWTLCFIVDFPLGTLLRSKLSPDTLLRSELSPGHSTSKYYCPPDTLLRSNLSPCKGDNLLPRGSLSFEVKCPGRTVCFEVKCLGDSLLRSNLPPGHFTSGGKLLRDSPLACVVDSTLHYFALHCSFIRILRCKNVKV